jgi:hypothetical protein
MNIVEIIYAETNVAVAFVECPDGIFPSTVVKHWVAMQGLKPEAIDQFKTNWGPIVRWNELKDVFVWTGKEHGDTE